MPSNTTFHFGEGKACSILQEFSTELSEEPRLTSEKSWRFVFSRRKNISSNCRIMVNEILTSIGSLHKCVSVASIFGDATMLSLFEDNEELTRHV